MAVKRANPWGGTFTDDDSGNTIYGSWYDDTIYANGGNDRVLADDGNDTVYGGAGDDQIEGGAGDDKLYGGADNDTLTGDAGDDIVDGGSGHDTVRGGGGDDVLRGGSGDDLLIDVSGADELDGGTGIDELNYATFGGKVDVTLNGAEEGTARQFVKMSLLPGQPAQWVEASPDRLFNIEDVVGSNGDDKITGDGNDNHIFGGLGADTLSGKGGNDTLLGFDGNDRIDGGAGYDTMSGGYGADTFVFREGETTTMRFNFNGPSLIDTITDFDWEDKIDLWHIDANDDLAGDQAFHFVAGGAYTGEAGELLVTRTFNGDLQDVYLVQGDTNGDARVDFMIEVHAYSQGLSFIF